MFTFSLAMLVPVHCTCDALRLLTGWAADTSRCANPKPHHFYLSVTEFRNCVTKLPSFVLKPGPSLPQSSTSTLRESLL